MVYVLYCFRHCFLLSRTVCILINYAVILPKVAGRAQCGMFSFSYVEHAGHKVNRARLKRASEISRTHEPNGAFSLCVCSHARVLLAFSRTLLTRAGIPKIFKKERSGAVGGGGECYAKLLLTIINISFIAFSGIIIQTHVFLVDIKSLYLVLIDYCFGFASVPNVFPLLSRSEGWGRS